MRYLFLLLFASGPTLAHELTPTYPKLEQSYVTGVLQTKVLMWNGRADVEYYKIEVTDENWNDVPFITNEKLLQLDYMERAEVEIFLPEDTSATYICTRSMLEKSTKKRSIISSKVCSKIK
jgi:hypothetical protein